ncbi:cell surface A33 antigen-like [Pundamilia nyererei]|uniref:Cell surface A33 antigen-like n=1 Tax=Pundamilia nyererei TaxID=303518 RepID=A0A9Y6SK25_9CICH|nr:PREDICTED: cell surface A33 antigen-like [Pundamilia nyererei]
MPPGPWASLCWILLSVCLLFASTDGKIIKAEPGQNVTLPCRTPHISVPIRSVVEWFRLDLQEGHVLMYRDEQFISMNQLPSFVNRVDLQDRQMKDGDVSLILKDVTSDDTGTFQCYVVQRGTNGRKSTVDHISTIYLRVVGSSDGHPTMKCTRNNANEVRIVQPVP